LVVESDFLLPQICSKVHNCRRVKVEVRVGIVNCEALFDRRRSPKYFLICNNLQERGN
jgi:hypothetical protein